MTNDEAKRAMAVLAVHFAGRIPAETAKAWAMEIEPFAYADGIAGVRRLSRTAKHPSLAELFEAIGVERDERKRRDGSKSNGHLQLVHTATPDAEQAARAAVAKQVAVDIATKRIPKDTDFAEEVARRMRAAREKTI